MQAGRVIGQTKRRPAGAGRWVRPGTLSLTVLILLYGLLGFYATWTLAFAQLHGNDLNAYLAATRRWLETGSPYVPSEVLGPFAYGPDTFLHPPIALALFAPFLVLPGVLWWAIPIGIVIGVVVSLRPAVWAWPVLALLAIYRVPIYVVGNTDLWACAFVALGVRFGWPAVLLIVKPSLAPFGLIGANRREWWLALGCVALAAIPFGSLWVDWFAVVRHAPAGLLYSLASIPTVALPIIAGLAARRRRGDAAASVATIG